MVATRTAGEGVPGANAGDGRLEAAVDGLGRVGVDTAAEARGICAAAEEDAVLHTGWTLDHAWSGCQLWSRRSPLCC